MLARTDLTDPGSSLIGTLVDHRYAIERLIGRGGMGMVYLARDLQEDRELVIKMLAPHCANDAAARTRFEREGRRLGALDHPNIVKMYGVGMHGSLPYLKMEYIEGVPLHRYLEGRRRLDIVEFVPLASQILSAVGYAHARDIMLRDVKPANIVLCERAGKSNVVKILDFGLAKRVEGDTLDVTKSHLVGTTTYLAPELIKGEPCDVRVDVYAMGVLFFVMLSGRRPILGDNEGALLYNHVFGEPLRLETVLPRGHRVPDRLIALIHRCLEKDPWDRPADARAMAENLFDCFPAKMFALPQANEASRKRMQEWANGRSLVVTTSDPEASAGYSPGVPPELTTQDRSRPILHVVRSQDGGVRPESRMRAATRRLSSRVTRATRPVRTLVGESLVGRIASRIASPMLAIGRDALESTPGRAMIRGWRRTTALGRRMTVRLVRVPGVGPIVQGIDRLGAGVIHLFERAFGSESRRTAEEELAAIRSRLVLSFAFAGMLAVLLGGGALMLIAKHHQATVPVPHLNPPSLSSATTTRAALPEDSDEDARLRVLTVEGAEVRVDGELQGEGPMELALAEGRHRIEVRMAGFAPFAQDIEFDPSDPKWFEQPLVASLEPATKPSKSRGKKKSKRSRRAKPRAVAKRPSAPAPAPAVEASAKPSTKRSGSLLLDDAKPRKSSGVFLPTGG